MKYILYGNVRDRSFRHVTESHIMGTGGEILFYVDDVIHDDKVGIETYDGKRIRVFSADIIIDYPEAVIVIMSAMGFSDIVSKLKRSNINNTIVLAPFLGWRFIIDRYCAPQIRIYSITEWINHHESELYDIFDMDDDYTNLILNEIVTERKEFSFVSPETYEQFVYEDYYVDPRVSPLDDFIFVDCGVYIGDTIESMCNRFRDRMRYVIGFEPEKGNIDKAESLVSLIGIDDRVRLISKGLWDRTGELRYTIEKDEININPKGKDSLPVVCLDDYSCSLEAIISDTNTESDNKVDVCIKMDLEGSEIPAIRGAKRVIQQNHPYMAICLYHKMDDILEIPRTIMEIRKDYRFYLRAGVHTELYAVPIRG